MFIKININVDKMNSFMVEMAYIRLEAKTTVISCTYCLDI
jgi:hypothetical protein